jgi:gamma-glutamyltranspeptidase/glutathione hydrolase
VEALLPVVTLPSVVQRFHKRNFVVSINAISRGIRPTFVLRKDGSLWFAVGSPGGPTIINTVLQVITNIIDSTA